MFTQVCLKEIILQLLFWGYRKGIKKSVISAVSIHFSRYSKGLLLIMTSLLMIKTAFYDFTSWFSMKRPSSYQFASLEVVLVLGTKLGKIIFQKWSPFYEIALKAGLRWIWPRLLPRTFWFQWRWDLGWASFTHRSLPTTLSDSNANSLHLLLTNPLLIQNPHNPWRQSLFLNHRSTLRTLSNHCLSRKPLLLNHL